MNNVEKAIEEIKKGNFVVVTDDDKRENEGDLVMAAHLVTPEKINFMSKFGRGLICTPMSPKETNRLNLTQMVPDNTERHGTAFTVSLDAKEDTTTGISAHDMAKTVTMLADPKSTRDDFLFPGHIFPLQAQDNGVIARDGHTEATVDLVKLATGKEIGILCEILNEDGTMARMPELLTFKERHNLHLVTIKELIEYQKRNHKLVKYEASANLPTQFGSFSVHAFRSIIDHKTHIALTFGKLNPENPVLARVHSQCLTGDALFSCRCDCGEQLKNAMQEIATHGSGIILYLAQEGRDIGLIEKIKAYELQDEGLDTVEANTKLGHSADPRDYMPAAQMLKFFNIESVDLISNNPEKTKQLENLGITINKQIYIKPQPNKYNYNYLATKKNKMNHQIDLDI